MDSIWKQETVPEVRHFAVAIYFAVAFIVARFLLHFFVYQKLAIRFLSHGTVKLNLSDAKKAKIAKFSESMWKLTYYATIQFCVLAITYQEPWFWNTKEYFRGWPNQHLKVSLKLFYMCQCGFYIYSIAALLTWETRRKDFSIMMSHHIITVILIGYSYITRFFCIGSIILALHDASDVFMEAAKLFKYSEKEFAASMCFGLFALSWLLLRITFFPVFVIRRTSYDLLDVLTLSNPHHLSIYYVFNTMLLMLLVFHIYWGILIVLMIWRQLKNSGRVGEDIRSDSEDGD